MGGIWLNVPQENLKLINLVRAEAVMPAVGRVFESKLTLAERLDGDHGKSVSYNLT